MRINIVSSDKRYLTINELLLQQGYDSFICSYEEKSPCHCLLLPIREELSDTELEQVLSNTDKSTVVLCGNDKRVKRYFDGKILTYGQDKELVLKNALLTAEAAISYIHSLTKSSLRDKRIFVSGYGKIGREVCRLLKALGACVLAYARREETKERIFLDGITSAELEECINCHIVINTVPAKIYPRSLTDKIPRDAYIVELASSPFGFEDMERVNVASGLPGRILEKSGAELIFKAIISQLSSMEGEFL